MTDAGYVVWSTGADGEAERDWSACIDGCPSEVRSISGPEGDIVAAGGSFIRWPADDSPASRKLSGATRALAARLDARLAALSPSMATLLDGDGYYEYRAHTPLPIGLSAIGMATATAMSGDGR